MIAPSRSTRTATPCHGALLASAWRGRSWPGKCGSAMDCTRLPSTLQSDGRRLRVVDSAHLDGVVSRNGAVRPAEIAAELAASPPPSLLRMRGGDQGETLILIVALYTHSCRIRSRGRRKLRRVCAAGGFREEINSGTIASGLKPRLHDMFYA